MPKFHIDPAGNPGQCRATKRCPYGDLSEDHYGSEAEARKSYELENESHNLELDSGLKTVLLNIGPRQLPNRAWSTLRRAMDDNRFSEHELNIAIVALNEEIQKYNDILQTPAYAWTAEERLDVQKLVEVSNVAVKLSQRLDSWKAQRKTQLKGEFGKTFDMN